MKRKTYNPFASSSLTMLGLEIESIKKVNFVGLLLVIVRRLKGLINYSSFVSRYFLIALI